MPKRGFKNVSKCFKMFESGKFVIVFSISGISRNLRNAFGYLYNTFKMPSTCLWNAFKTLLESQSIALKMSSKCVHMPLTCLQRSLRHFLNCFRKCDKDKKSIAIGEAFWVSVSTKKNRGFEPLWNAFKTIEIVVQARRELIDCKPCKSV